MNKNTLIQMIVENRKEIIEKSEEMYCAAFNSTPYVTHDEWTKYYTVVVDIYKGIYVDEFWDWECYDSYEFDKCYAVSFEDRLVDENTWYPGGLLNADMQIDKTIRRLIESRDKFEIPFSLNNGMIFTVANKKNYMLLDGRLANSDDCFGETLNQYRSDLTHYTDPELNVIAICQPFSVDLNNNFMIRNVDSILWERSKGIYKETFKEYFEELKRQQEEEDQDIPF